MKEFILVRLLTNKKFLSVCGVLLLAILCIPLMLITMLSTFIGSLFGTVNPDAVGNGETDVVCIAIEELSDEYDIDNSISSSILRAVDLLQDTQIINNLPDAKSFVNGFIREEIVVDDDDDDDYDIYYYFYTDTEIIEKIKAPPYNFDDEAVKVVHALALAPIEDEEVTIQEEFAGSLIMPCDGAVTSGFGMRTHPVLHKKYMHYGIDIAPGWHSPLVAIADGVVVEVNTVPGDGYGNNITIKHKTKEYGTIYTNYSHLSEVRVKKGQKVKQGDVVGLEGGQKGVDPNPGYTTGHHLHFEIRKGMDRKTAVNPLNYLSGLT